VFASKPELQRCLTGEAPVTDPENDATTISR